MGAIASAVVAILLVAAPASQAATPSPTPPPSNQQFQNSISGFLRDDTRAPLEGVKITAKSGAFTGTATSGANGSWSIAVPTQGTYVVELDVSTLPKGIKLAEGQANPRTVTFSQTSNLSVIFRTTGLTNFAHGEMVTLGAVLVFAFNAMHLPFWLAIILALIGGGLFGWAQDAGLWRPLRRRGTGLVPMMIVSIGLALAVRYIIQFYFGGATQQLPFAQSAEIQIGPVSISPNNLWSLLISVIVIAALGLVLLKTRLGKAT